MNDPDVLFPWEKEGGDPQAAAERADAGDAGHAHAGVESGRDAAGSDEAGQDAGQGAATSEASAAPHAEATPAAAGRDEAEPGNDAGAATSLASNDVDDAGAVDAVDATGDADTAQATADVGNATASADAPADAAAADTLADDVVADDTTDDESRFEVLDTEYARQAAERASAALREKPVAQKEYYAISEVCELVGLKPHVLRYWETQFQVLNPSKNRSGNRVYQRKEIRLISLVKHLLYEEKYTVEGAKA
ncbi:MAG TPA: MerR family transcriptional regulator, partial [Longimicrobiales bacterium]|nr:MerR family transcriptional regulator [Longimicrobiales bacterium]